MKIKRRLVFIFANLHLLTPSIRQWVITTLWNQKLEPLKKYGILAIFACEGSDPICPASYQENKIYLAEFTIRDTERFLRTLSFVAPEEVPELAQRIHSGRVDKFLATPQRIYQNLIAEAILRNWW